MLAVDQIHTYYGESHILQGMSLTVNAGEVVAILGRNGAGKTTTVRSVIGWTPPRRGRITFEGRQVSGLSAQRIAQMGIGIVPQGRRIFANLTVRENLEIATRQGRGDGPAWNLEKVFQLFPRLRERQRNWGNELSGGEQSLLAVGRALMTNSRLLLMDEPSEGLSPLMVREVIRVLRELKQMGISVLLVEQNLGMALAVADRIYVINKGRTVHQATPAELKDDQGIKQRFLGV